jgi:uncharacterized membrane protein
MKRTDDSGMNESNWFYMIVWLGMLLVLAVFILFIDRVIDFVLRR